LDVEVPDDKKAACGQVSGERITYVGRTETERKALPVSSYSPLRGKDSSEPILEQAEASTESPPSKKPER